MGKVALPWIQQALRFVTEGSGHRGGLAWKEAVLWKPSGEPSCERGEIMIIILNETTKG